MKYLVIVLLSVSMPAYMHSMGCNSKKQKTSSLATTELAQLRIEDRKSNKPKRLVDIALAAVKPSDILHIKEIYGDDFKLGIYQDITTWPREYFERHPQGITELLIQLRPSKKNMTFPATEEQILYTQVFECLIHTKNSPLIGKVLALLYQEELQKWDDSKRNEGEYIHVEKEYRLDFLIHALQQDTIHVQHLRLMLADVLSRRYTIVPHFLATLIDTPCCPTKILNTNALNLKEAVQQILLQKLRNMHSDAPHVISLIMYIPKITNASLHDTVQEHANKWAEDVANECRSLIKGNGYGGSSYENNQKYRKFEDIFNCQRLIAHAVFQLLYHQVHTADQLDVIHKLFDLIFSNQLMPNTETINEMLKTLNIHELNQHDWLYSDNEDNFKLKKIAQGIINQTIIELSPRFRSNTDVKAFVASLHATRKAECALPHIDKERYLHLLNQINDLIDLV